MGKPPTTEPASSIRALVQTPAALSPNQLPVIGPVKTVGDQGPRPLPPNGAKYGWNVGPASFVAPIWRMNQSMEDLSLFLCLPVVLPFNKPNTSIFQRIV